MESAIKFRKLNERALLVPSPHMVGVVVTALESNPNRVTLESIVVEKKPLPIRRPSTAPPLPYRTLHADERVFIKPCCASDGPTPWIRVLVNKDIMNYLTDFFHVKTISALLFTCKRIHNIVTFHWKSIKVRVHCQRRYMLASAPGNDVNLVKTPDGRMSMYGAKKSARRCVRCLLISGVEYMFERWVYRVNGFLSGVEADEMITAFKHELVAHAIRFVYLDAIRYLYYYTYNQRRNAHSESANRVNAKRILVKAFEESFKYKITARNIALVAGIVELFSEHFVTYKHDKIVKFVYKNIPWSEWNKAFVEPAKKADYYDLVLTVSKNLNIDTD
jgi:hypothetical protein